MNPADTRSRIAGALWGSLVGDALGVPVEFQDRTARVADPVTGLRGHGTHGQPAGTWSDDGALLLCTIDSLLASEFDAEDMGRRFVQWHDDGLWTARGDVFDIGIATANALRRIKGGSRAAQAGGADVFDNGNGSLMRILPVSIRFAGEPADSQLPRIHTASAITHRHKRSEMACGFHALMVRALLAGKSTGEAFAEAAAEFVSRYAGEPWLSEMMAFQLLLTPDFAGRQESEIDSSGYVIHTLTAALWCLLTTRSFSDCVLKAVNLGGDTDTTGCVAGGLAGLVYGIDAIPPAWLAALPRQQEVGKLFDGFTGLMTSDPAFPNSEK